MKNQRTISEIVRAAIEVYPESRNEFCRRTGIDKADLSRFMAGQKTITIETLDRFADELGLELVARTRRK